MSEWFETEALWEKTFPLLFPESRFAGTPKEIEDLLALVAGEPKDALDLCCGPGRASVELARKGMNVTGVDLSAFMLDKARNRAAAAAVEVEWVRSDMREFIRPASFDLALSLFTSFGYFETREDNLRVLTNVRQSLRPGGALVMEIMNKERLARVFSPASVMENEGTVLIEQRRVLPGWSRMENTWYVLSGGRYETFTISHWIYSGEELCSLLAQAGFESARTYGSFAGAPFVGDARLHVVTRAPSK
jgi:SAM-dependent methyltransferase